MSTYCSDPQFPYDEVNGWYLACTTCGELAWAHAGADPLADIRNAATEMLGQRPTPPVVRPG